jgi:bis(5'-nucleosyl)-tetraphosphatase (symmetrical)
MDSSRNPHHAKVRLESTKIWVVGDVHGCLDELKTMISQIKERGGSYSDVYLVGDLVNKGPYSAEVIRYCSENRIQTVVGNHDLAALARWEESSNGEEVEEKYDYVKQLNQADVKYLKAAPRSISFYATDIETNGPSEILPLITVVHAGIVPEVPLEDQTLKDLTEIRLVSVNADADAGSRSWQAYYPPKDDDDKKKGEQPPSTTHWFEVYFSPSNPSNPLIVYGHDATMGLQQTATSIGIDTGCCYGNQLSACEVTINLEDCRVDRREIIQVAAKRVYSEPNFKKVG